MKAERLAEVLSTWSTKTGPLHQRLSDAIQGAIIQGALLPAVRLPAERELARALSLSRTTIVTAYDCLREGGWLESRTGSGTWVSRKHASGARSQAHAGVVARGSLLNLLQMNDPALIDLAMASTQPLAELVERATVRAQEAIGSILRQGQYMPFGLNALRQAIAASYTAGGTPTTVDQILVTTGSQQAISLITSLFVHRGDRILAESPTFFGALEAFRFAGARLFPVPLSREHVVPEVLVRRIAAVQPHLIYLTPTCQNPTGTILPTFAREQIARDAEEHEVPIIEDESLADLIFRSKRLPAIAKYSKSASILTLGSLSKLISSSLRVGWIRGPVPLITRLAKLKSAADLGSPTITQAIATELFADIEEARVLRRAELKVKRDLLVSTIKSGGVDWRFEVPQGGMSLWVNLPGVDTQVLAQLALRHSVAIAPGRLFSVDDSHSEFLRLPFLLDPQFLMLGAERLIQAWRESMAAPERFGMAPDLVMV